MKMNDRGLLTKEQMMALLEPNALEPEMIRGIRIRWAYSTTRENEDETRVVSNALKARHLELGAYEVLVHHGPWLRG